MGFLSNKTKVSLELPMKKEAAQKVLDNIVVIVNKLSANEIELLARAVNNPIFKSAAINYLKENIN